MAALTADKAIIERATGKDFNAKLKAAVKVFKGALIMLETATGLYKPAVSAAGQTHALVAEEFGDNTNGSGGAIAVKAREGVFCFLNPASLTATSIGVLAYAVDSQSVNATSASQSIVGCIVDVDADGVWVDLSKKVAG